MKIGAEITRLRNSKETLKTQHERKKRSNYVTSGGKEKDIYFKEQGGKGQILRGTE